MKVRILAFIILIVGLAAGFYDTEHILGYSNSWLKPFRLGLDLQGGTHLVYRADISSIPSGEVKDAMDGLRDVIERRVNSLGVSEPLVQTENVAGDNRLIVELAGVFDIKEAIRAIGATPFLEFRELSSEAKIKLQDKSSYGKISVTDFVTTKLTGRFLQHSTMEFANTTASPAISLQFNDEGSRLFEEITTNNVDYPVGIFLDGIMISNPVVREKITGGKAQITGQFTIQEAKSLVQGLNTGALPVPITLLSQQSVAASLGQEALTKSLWAGIYGTIIVMLFMILWYRLPGIIAVLALGVYASITLLLFKLIPVTLSSAGIAGFILSIGMAVDANILIFERMKEELQLGKTIDTAMTEGFKRAWTSIRDSNVSSLITSVILYWFGTSIVRGFALTLALGILVSMFTAITASRFFLRALPHRGEGRAVRFLFGTGVR
ncbi:MAG: protein translocase subunit SecD [Patescibacteria group bacterium]